MNLVLIFMSLFSVAQDTLKQVEIEGKVLISDVGATPFWLRSLQYGSVPQQGPAMGLRMKADRHYLERKRFDWRYSFEGTAWIGKQTNLFLTEAFVSGRWRKWELYAGRKKEIYGLGDSTLSSGFYAWSGNALPLPKLQLGTRDYLPLFNKWIGLHMTYSHGWFDGMGVLKNAYLHQKSLYGRIGRPDSRLQLYGGLNHQVHWGGERNVKSTARRVINYYPSSLNAYFYVVTLLKNRNWVKVDARTTSDDAENQYGNHLGSIDLAARYRMRWGHVLAYRQTAYEQGAVFNLSPADDGLTGLSIRINGLHFIEGITLEHLYTGNQGQYRSWVAKLFNTVDTHNGEGISYLYNGARASGWRYKLDEIGTPLILMDSKSLQGSGERFTYNAVNAVYMGLQGHLTRDIQWQFRGSRTLSYNVLSPKFRDQRFVQYAYGLNLTKIKSDWLHYNLAFGYDQGDRLEGSFGLQFGIKLLFL